MKAIGLVGGTTPESTTMYYELLIRGARELLKDPDPLRNPVIIIYSIDLAVIAELQRQRRFDELAANLGAVCERLRGAGAEVGALTANTPHVYLDAIKRHTTLPIVSILDAVFEKASALGVKRPLLLGTNQTMESPMYPQRFAVGQVEVLLPQPAGRKLVSDAIYGELALGVVSPAFRQGLLALCQREIEQHGIDAVILGCTELPLVLKEGDLPVPLLDTASLHVDAILDRAMG